ncbi:uncharacterized protein LOC114245151 [Bombyx mandarina]|uniref:Uncharacterized protein n=2 Tax=Bombyx TaxID=7090 RepID=A0A8R1WM83_BOMMO|nr:uncharacterized protein LOC101740601 [Bombyx mori]XP_028032992.1 uncharacterized protein LOC114245151 [Bombyx mandarina]
MFRPTRKQLPVNLVLTALLTSGITIVCSISYIVLSALSLIYRSNCHIGLPENLSNSDLFWIHLYRLYIQEGCDQSIYAEDLTTSGTVFILSAITLAISIVLLIVSGFLTSVVQNNERIQYVNLAVYGYIIVSLLSLIVDLTFGTYFGIDYKTLSDQLDASDGNLGSIYAKEITRQGAFYLMTIVLKGYVYHVINLVLIILLAMYTLEYGSALQKNEHSIHKMGILNAFETNRRINEGERRPQYSDMTYPPFVRSMQVNHGFNNDDELPRIPTRDPIRIENSSNRSFDRSDSWHHSRSVPDPAQSGRPFSYLEEIKRTVPVRPSTSPEEDPRWRREWTANTGPPLPAPDYSPQQPRRLKSALKSAYM